MDEKKNNEIKENTEIYDEVKKLPKDPEPEMSFGRRFVYLWESVIVKWGIGLIVSVFFSAIIMILYSKGDMGNFLGMAQDQDALFTFAEEVVLKYTTVIEGVTALLTIIVMLLIMKKDRTRNGGKALLEKKKGFAYQIPAVMLMSGSLSLALNNLILIGNLNQYSEVYEETTEAFFSSSLGMQILCLCILVPMSEELVFRGVMYQRLRKSYPSALAILYTAFVFAFLHGNLVQGIYGFLMGLLLGYVMEKAGSVLAPMLAHITANLLTVLCSNYDFYSWEMTDIRLIGCITVVGAVLATCMYLFLNAKRNVYSVES